MNNERNIREMFGLESVRAPSKPQNLNANMGIANSAAGAANAPLDQAQTVKKILRMKTLLGLIMNGNAKLYDLRATSSAADGMQLLTGRILEHATEQDARGESNFRVWFHPNDAAGLPARIEFRPRSFLRLVFEQDPAAAGPILRCLIPEEKT